MKLQEIKNRYFITLPVQICRAKGWEKGKELELKFNDKGELVIKEATQ